MSMTTTQLNRATQMIYNLHCMGLSVAAGIGCAANAEAESGLRPESESPRAVGLFQWTDNSESNARTEMLTELGDSWKYMSAQLPYMVKCAKKRYAYQAKVDGDSSQQYGSVTHLRELGYSVSPVTWAEFIACTDYKKATVSFLAIFEDDIYSQTAEWAGYSLADWAAHEVNTRTGYAEEIYTYWKKVGTKMAEVFSPKQTGEPQCHLDYAGEDVYHAGCGLGCVLAITGKDGLDAWTEARNWMRNHGEDGIPSYESSGSGTYAEGVNAYLNAHGYKATKLTGSHSEAGVNTAGKEQLKAHLQAGGRGWTLWGGTKTGCPSDYWCTSGHFGSIHKYDPTTGLYLVADPSYDARDGWHSWDEIYPYLKHYGIVDAVATTTTKTTTSTEDDNMQIYEKCLELKIGMGAKQSKSTLIGLHVLNLQEKLKGKGIKAVKEFTYKGKTYKTNGDGKEIECDREFGNNLAAALMYYKAINGLPINAICDKATWKVIYGGI